jgi:hypothetical protein
VVETMLGAPGTTIVPSTASIGGPMRTNRYHRSPTRHNTNRRTKRCMPALPAVAPVMMKAAKSMFGKGEGWLPENLNPLLLL